MTYLPLKFIGAVAGCDWGWQPELSQLYLTEVARSDFFIGLYLSQALRSLSKLALLDPPSSAIGHQLLVSCQRVIGNW
ncbi:MAG: hypothetical protein ACRC62_11820 [Microcoleus sp.]